MDGAFLGNNSDLWSKVNDFGWIKATPSPNWWAYDKDWKYTVNMHVYIQIPVCFGKLM